MHVCVLSGGEGAAGSGALLRGSERDEEQTEWGLEELKSSQATVSRTYAHACAKDYQGLQMPTALTKQLVARVLCSCRVVSWGHRR